MNRINSYKEDTKIFDERTNNTKYCKRCGHAIVFQRKTKKIICTHCGHWVYNNKLDEFKDKLLQKKKRLENESKKAR